MEEGSNLIIPDIWKGTVSYYAVCNNKQQCRGLWFQLDTTLNHQGHRNMTQFSMAVVMEGVCILF